MSELSRVSVTLYRDDFYMFDYADRRYAKEIVEKLGEGVAWDLLVSLHYALKALDEEKEDE